MAKILLFNPRSAKHKPRIPNSILQVAASVEGKYDYVIVDGNLEENPFKKIEDYFNSGDFNYFGITVMPGPQLKQAIPFSKKIKSLFPNVKIIWGGYFPSNQPKTVLESEFVDVIVNGPGDKSFPLLINAFENNSSLETINNLIYLREGKMFFTKKDELYDQDELPALPYEKLNTFYPIKKYLGKTYLGSKTIAYHSSIGCPFTCSFCAVVPIYNARWRGKSPINIYNDIKYLKEQFGGNAIEFHDNNFFVSEKRTVEFCRLIKKENMIWWGEGRIDTINKYKDESLQLMRESGCRMIYFGAETGDDQTLAQIDKGGTQTGEQILSFAERLGKFGIIPEYSFILGLPAPTEEEVNRKIDNEIKFIKKVKRLNPATEIIMYVYSPVPTVGSELFDAVKKDGFKFPEKLEDWISGDWENFDLRKNPLTPWLKPNMINKIKNFETVINGYSPTQTDVRLNISQRFFLRNISKWRYHSGVYKLPYEIKLFHKIWKYRQPEIEGF
ncbi:MAG TPA: radical SAM protein [Bacteroidia bacterium]|jgi:anaerobic magnesium-protoporphyrin IX monomethyl ester cyclase|nr:radical SAM protein [Bacteroidia bacterium]